jgi:hypothetical protein
VGLVLTVLVVSAVALAGCGGGEPSKADQAAVGKTALKDSQLKVSPAAERCIGKSLIDDLGIESAKKAVSQGNFSKMPKTQRKAAVSAFDQCVPSSAFVTTFVSQLPAGTSSDKLSACLTKQFDGKVGTVAAAMSDPKSDTATTKLFDKCPTHALAVNALESGLSSGGVPADVATCVIAQLNDLKLSDVVTQSKALETQVEAAAKSCEAGK